MADKFKYSDDQIKDLLDGIYAGSITEHDLPEDLYYAIADYLKSGLYSGFGGTLTDFAGKDLELLQELRENIYMFSAAKTYQETKDIRDMMFNSDGDLVSNREFNQLGAQAFDQWNNDWGRTEYNTARAQAQTAGQWNEIQSSKDILPFLTYSTIGDACAICAPLDGFTAHVDDPVWDSIMPVNHFNCECIVTQEDEEAIPTPTDEKESIYNQVTGEMSDEFKMNSGKDGYIFSPEHPYFEVAPKDREYAANNFNLPIPSIEEETKGKVLEFTEAKTIKEAGERMNDLGVKYFEPKGYSLDHANASLRALETIPEKAIPDALGNGKAFADWTDRPLGRKADQWYGVSIKYPDLYKEGRIIWKFGEERVDYDIVGINTRQFSIKEITEKKIAYNEFYNKKFGRDYFLHTDGELTHFHEFGHVYQHNTYSEKFNEEWKWISKKWFNSAKFDVLKSENEAFAEAFADYYGNDSKLLPDYVKEFFDKNVK